MGRLEIHDDALIETLQRLAALRQTSVEDALRRAVEEAAAASEAEAERKARRRAANTAIIARSAPLFPKDWDGRHDDLYDEDGLPA